MIAAWHHFFKIIIIVNQLPSPGPERDDFKEKLEQESREMLCEFAALVSSTEKALIHEKITVGSLVLIIETLHPLLKRDNNKLKKKLKKLGDNNITEAMLVMTKYWSFFDHDILSAIIKRCQESNPELIAKHDAYITLFEKYCQRRLCEISFEALSSDKEDVHPKDLIGIKLDDVFTVPVNDVKRIMTKISRILGTSLRLVEFRKGCVELICISMHELSPLNNEQKNDLYQTKNILRIYSDSRDLFNTSDKGMSYYPILASL